MSKPQLELPDGFEPFSSVLSSAVKQLQQRKRVKGKIYLQRDGECADVYSGILSVGPNKASLRKYKEPNPSTIEGITRLRDFHRYLGSQGFPLLYWALILKRLSCFLISSNMILSLMRHQFLCLLNSPIWLVVFLANTVAPRD